MLSPPVPLLSVKSPPWSMKLGITRWKMLPLLHSHRKEEVATCQQNGGQTNFYVAVSTQPPERGDALVQWLALLADALLACAQCAEVLHRFGDGVAVKTHHDAPSRLVTDRHVKVHLQAARSARRRKERSWWSRVAQ